MPEPEIRIPDARHEGTDIAEGFIWIAAVAVLATLILCGLIVLWLYPQSRLDRTLELPLALYPAPRLQPDPPSNLKQFQAAQRHALNSTGWVDRSQGVVHIPISAAMRDVAQEGITDWPTASQKSK